MITLRNTYKTFSYLNFFRVTLSTGMWFQLSGQRIYKKFSSVILQILYFLNVTLRRDTITVKPDVPSNSNSDNSGNGLWPKLGRRSSSSSGFRSVNEGVRSNKLVVLFTSESQLWDIARLYGGGEGSGLLIRVLCGAWVVICKNWKANVYVIKF